MNSAWIALSGDYDALEQNLDDSCHFLLGFPRLIKYNWLKIMVFSISIGMARLL
jgi:hypothetical protein